ncbi:GNAT family N-acetyltransferase [Bacillus sp. FJAT-49732]|uniref:GNAT family N-acetyltransferase n=1 Tax=Lederbergia citrisecunda TaxID=2833583 RepID=A0A942YMB8_9BACI|nr:GNAT family N-acetyltransferase [Lederbergia citrisecunda]MBS4199176.1 GNAT family N-acetyltransferase [Lederbergia citrisecunda]
MNIKYEIIPIEKAYCCKELCNELMVFQKSMAKIKPELFDDMNFETRMLPSIKSAIYNQIVVVRDGDIIVGYVYSNISPKEAYSNNFATFFDLSSVHRNNVGCLSQLYIKEEYRRYGIGSKLFEMSMKWLTQFDDIEDYFIFVSNGNEEALEFYKRKGFAFSHNILNGFITVLRNKRLANT